MKAKYALIALLAITFFGCDDNTGGLGLGMFPGNDQNIKGKLSTFDVTTKSVETGNIYAKTNIGYVGKFTDETFGTYKAGFLAQLNCPQYLTFPEVYKETEFNGSQATKAEGTIVTDFTNIDLSEEAKSRYCLIESGGEIIGNCQINIYLSYSSYFGDSLTACRLSIYELDKKLDINSAYYTNINPDLYYDKSTGLLGTKAYTAVDMSVPESDRNASDYYPTVGIRLSKPVTEDLGKRILESAKTNGQDFYKYFQDIFRGIYVNSDYGDGTVLYIDQVQMDIVSLRYVTDSISGVKYQTKAGKDSIAYTGRSFVSTREVIQANQLQNDKEAIQACIDKPDCTYLKSPAGIFTEATLPISEIDNKLEGDTLNAVKLAFTNFNQTSDKKFGMTIPSSVMLIRKKLKDSFFEKNQLSDNISSYLSQHNTSTNQYTFSNITKLVNVCINERKAALAEIEKKGSITIEVKDDQGNLKPEIVTDIKVWETKTEWDKVVLIPVLVTYDSSNTTTGQANIIRIQHDLKPGYVRLKGGEAGEGPDGNPDYKLKLEVISTDFGLTTKSN